jgi:hypothetical protein
MNALGDEMSIANDRYEVRLALADDGLALFWLVEAATGKRILSSVFRDSVLRLADAMNRRRPEAGCRQEAGCWT